MGRALALQGLWRFFALTFSGNTYLIKICVLVFQSLINLFFLHTVVCIAFTNRAQHTFHPHYGLLLSWINRSINRSFDSVYIVKEQGLSVVVVKLMGNLEREKTREIATDINKISLTEEDFPGESLQWKKL